jgi:hypothetical protein
MYWSSSSGRIELDITKKQAAQAAHPGQCDKDVFALSQVPTIRRQLQRVDPDDLVAELSEYGAWEPDELADHDANLQRILWLACGDINEEQAA